MVNIFFDLGTVFYSFLFWNKKVIIGIVTPSSLIDLLKNINEEVKDGCRRIC